MVLRQGSFGAEFLSSAHCLSRDFRHAYIAASLDAQHPFVPAGSSPLLDPYYSTAQLQVHHHGSYMPRLERTRLVAEWPAGLDNIRVCVRDERGTTNSARARSASARCSRSSPWEAPRVGRLRGGRR